ncbi:hypothetical protein [Bremerella volcania]|nr:hypothetical protein [Bremerella volcania]
MDGEVGGKLDMFAGVHGGDVLDETMIGGFQKLASVRVWFE